MALGQPTSNVCLFLQNKGHTQKILDTISSNSQLTSFDKDSDAIEHANNIENTNFKIIHDSFSNINKYFRKIQ